jgi:RNA polymerase sigma-70 factor (ECF subfamily)
LNPTAEACVDGFDEDVRRMLAFREGDMDAFDALFQRWAGPLLRYLERMLHDAASAEDLVQEVFLRVHRARERYRPEARFSTWIFRIATNLALNELRRPRRRDPHESLDAENGPEPSAPATAIDEFVDAKRMAGDVERALRSLPERQRAALWLGAVEGFSYAEVGASLDVSEKAVKALVHRARSNLASRLESARERVVDPARAKGLAGKGGVER